MVKGLVTVLNTVLKTLRILFQKSYKRFPNNENISISRDLRIGASSKVEVEKNTIIEINQNVVFKEFCNILVYSNAKLHIEENVFFNNFCSLNCLGSLRIGKNTMFGEGVKLYDHNHKYHWSFENLVVERDQFKIGKIIIGSNCWIGSNTVILNNVEIGDSVIIGANCLIIKSIPSNSIVKHIETLNIETIKQ